MPDEEEKHLISDRALLIALGVLVCIDLVLLTIICYLELRA